MKTEEPENQKKKKINLDKEVNNFFKVAPRWVWIIGSIPVVWGLAFQMSVPTLLVSMKGVGIDLQPYFEAKANEIQVMNEIKMQQAREQLMISSNCTPDMESFEKRLIAVEMKAHSPIKK